MKIWNVPIEEVSRIVADVSDRLFDGNIRFKRSPEKAGRAVQFTLTVADSRARGGRISSAGRRVCACCWHGHRDVMTALFTDYPGARLKTARADYRGRDDFDRQFESTGFSNIGSCMAPMCYSDACECEG